MSRLDLYTQYHARLFAPLLDMMVGGIRVDEERRAARHAEVRAHCTTLLERCNEIAGTSVFGPKGGVSRPKLSAYLYETLGLPKQYIGRGEGRKVTTRAIAIRRLGLAYPAKVRDFSDAVCAYVRQDKLSQFLAGGRTDADGRMRCTYKLNTEAARLASAKNPKRTGDNLQNQDAEARDIFLPDEGQLWMKLDLAGIENRLAAYFSRDPELIRRAQLPPWEFDEHSLNASLVFGRQYEEFVAAKRARDAVTITQRRVGKETVHGTWRGMGGDTLSDRLMKYGYVHTPDECRGFIAAYKSYVPAIETFFARIRRTLMESRRLRNDFGFELAFPYDRLNEETFGRAYSFPMQSHAGMHLNVKGLIPAHAFLRAKRAASRLLAQVHDELDFSVAPDEAWPIYRFVADALEAPTTVDGQPFRAFVTCSLGTSWKCEHEFERPPSRAEFDAVVAQLIAKKQDVAA